MKTYELIYNEIKQKIDNGIYHANQQLPSLRDLSKIYNSTPVTVKKSLMILLEKGYLSVKDRVGFFVAAPDTHNLEFTFHEIKSIKSVINEIRIERVENIDTEVILHYYPEEMIAGIITTKNCIAVRRILLSNSMPIAYDIKYLFTRKPINIKSTYSQNYERWIKSMSIVLEHYDVVKELSITVMEDNSYCREILYLDENDSVFEFFQVFRAKNGQIAGLGHTFIPCIELDLKVVNSNIQENRPFI